MPNGHGSPPAEGAPRTVFRQVLVIGGGCYGTFYATQLKEARARGRLEIERVIVVDRDPECRAAVELPPDPVRELAVSDWSDFLDRFFERPAPAAGTPDDAIVPSPLMPHLMAEWLLRFARRRWPDRPSGFVPVLVPLGTPYDVQGRDGNRYVSFADWLCPTHCIEPHTCPMIRAPRTWEMRDAVTEYTALLGRERNTVGPALFITRHRAFGVGMFDADELRAARLLLESAAGSGNSVDVIVGTISACHGAIGLLRLGQSGEQRPSFQADGEESVPSAMRSPMALGTT